MRILILDGSRVLVELVRRLVPAGVEIESATSFDHAVQVLRLHPPDAVIANVSPANLRWTRIQELCHDHRPPIPVLYESCVFTDATDAGFHDLDAWSAFLPKPYHTDDLRTQIQRLLAAAHRSPN